MAYLNGTEITEWERDISRYFGLTEMKPTRLV